MRFATLLLLMASLLMSCGSGGSDTVSSGMRSLNRADCLAYIYLDSWAKRETGAITEAQFKEDGLKIARKLHNRGDNYNYASVFRRFNARADRLIEDNLTPGQAALKVEECRPIVHI